MKPASFDYIVPLSVDGALEDRARFAGDASVLAGGQSLLPILNLRLAAPTVLIDVGRLTTLAGVSEEPDRLRIGAMTTLRFAERSPEIQAQCGLLAQALPLIGHVAIRNRGTVGGSLAHADPAAELPVAALALDAEMVVRRTGGTRVVAAASFFRGFMSTAIEPDELLVEVRVPRNAPRTGTSFVEVARRRGDFALVSIAAVVTLGDRGEIAEPRLAIGGVASVPVRAADAEQLLRGEIPGGQLLDEVAATAVRGLEPLTDLHASSSYRRRLIQVLVRRALVEAIARAKANQ